MGPLILVKVFGRLVSFLQDITVDVDGFVEKIGIDGFLKGKKRWVTPEQSNLCKCLVG